MLKFDSTVKAVGLLSQQAEKIHWMQPLEAADP